MCEYCDDTYEPGAFYPEYTFYPDELREYLKNRRSYDPDFRLYIDEAFIQELEIKLHKDDEALLKVDQEI